MGKQPGQKSLKPGERIAIGQLAIAGNTTAQIAKVLHRSPGTIKRAIEDAKALIRGNATVYAELHMTATEIAAQRGNAEPAQWALERIGVVEPAKGAGGPGLQVRIGVMLPGLGQSAVSVDGNSAIEAESTEVIDK